MRTNSFNCPENVSVNVKGKGFIQRCYVTDILIKILVASLLVSQWQASYASDVQVIECTNFLALAPLPFESLNTRFTIRRHIEHTQPVEEISTDIWSQGKFENNGEFEVTVYPFEGEPKTERSTSTKSRLLDGNEVLGDEYFDEAPTMGKTLNYEGFTMDSLTINLHSQSGTAIDDHRVVPPVIDREVWDPWCTGRCHPECTVAWRAPGDGIPCEVGSPGHSGGLCKVGSYLGLITSISTEPHDHEHGEGEAFTLNEGLNDAWITQDAALQGMFVTVFPVLELVFVAWFTFDTAPPAGEDIEAVFGASDQRWVTAVGSFSGNRAVLKAELTSGGRFNSSNPVPVQDTNYGEIILEFSNCSEGRVSFNFPTVGEAGEFAISRVLDSNERLCEELRAQ